mgnify:CR=1 FL=1|jgi:cbb3-type cytochrome oxidase maturation protein
MSILYLLIPLSLLLLSLAVWAFFWAVKNDQFDDLEGPAHRILFDDDEQDLSPAARQRRKRAQTATDDAQPAPQDAQTGNGTERHEKEKQAGQHQPDQGREDGPR